ncbi:sugar ABC transporter ATP-binding protein [Amphibacillus xylanus]|uniref:Putative ribose ABC transporter ATP-binding protein n=1 Tax=Amphibacillus xylanus (strain ATCC 51415 / DSM 6626 / JCM 7361 / LMG 17667 / NBRC 15112 / Ep01) TaxID=698758 RepID=K0J5A9_AMPXN|nr:sugar ABC transporter ATP-binding protein [Amphibacillus xylanus]BAM48086.1 putative ribose ABC transporter ATP-binding protein [Amphibacillus xylanus NBRC 15112]
MIINMTGIDKSFSTNQVLKGVNFSVEKGETHALMGENGAGKSTLMKILSGIYQRDAGIVEVKGKQVKYQHPSDAEADGIAVIHQELNILPELTIAENLFLGKELTKSKFGWLNNKEMNRIAKERLEELGLNLSPTVLAKDLSVGRQQLVEIAKALMTNADVIIMDEPTAALTDREIDTLFEVIERLKRKGVSFIYISHRMEEIFAICDRITVLRDGASIGTKVIKETNFDEIVSMMVGRELGDRFPSSDKKIGDVKLQVSNLTREGEFEDVSFDVKAGEILGISGLMGAGRSEVVETIFGYRRQDKGSIYLDGQKVSIKHPQDAINKGIAFISEDRKTKGLIVDFSVGDNLNLTNLKTLSNNGWMLSQKEQTLYQTMVERLNIRVSDRSQLAKSLSGGNQQKVVIAKWLGIGPGVLILDEPTRGVDVGSKKEIYKIMQDLASQGVAIIMVSSELPEIIGMSDRVAVMCEGKLMTVLNKDQLTEENIMHYATGGEKHVRK